MCPGSIAEEKKMQMRLILDFVFIFKIILISWPSEAPNTARPSKAKEKRGFTVLVLLLSLSILRLVLKRASFSLMQSFIFFWRQRHSQEDTKCDKYERKKPFFKSACFNKILMDGAGERRVWKSFLHTSLFIWSYSIKICIISCISNIHVNRLCVQSNQWSLSFLVFSVVTTIYGKPNPIDSSSLIAYRYYSNRCM